MYQRKLRKLELTIDMFYSLHFKKRKGIRKEGMKDQNFLQ